MLPLPAKRAEGLTNTNLVERPTKLNNEGPGAADVTALSATPEPPELPPCEANAAQPENIAAASNISSVANLRIFKSPKRFDVLDGKTGVVISSSKICTGSKV